MSKNDKADAPLSLYTEADMVAVVDEFGNELPPVPKSWLGTDLLLEGVVEADSADGEAAKATPQPPDPSVEPAGNASTDVWAAHARFKGATDADLLDEDGKALTRDGIKAKYGTPTGS